MIKQFYCIVDEGGNIYEHTFDFFFWKYNMLLHWYISNWLCICKISLGLYWAICLDPIHTDLNWLWIEINVISDCARLPKSNWGKSFDVILLVHLSNFFISFLIVLSPKVLIAFHRFSSTHATKSLSVLAVFLNESCFHLKCNLSLFVCTF